jgi:myosin-crossreactive antigen
VWRSSGSITGRHEQREPLGNGTLHAQDRAMRTYLVGGGIGSLAAAAFLIRDAGVLGDDISILEQERVLGGSLDGGGDPLSGYSLRGGRMLTTDNYECTWDLFKSIPSLDVPGKSVFDETVEFNARHPSHSMARLVDRRCAKVPVTSMGFTMQDRLELLKLASADEDALGTSRITDWLSPGFYETAFWAMWATTFAFQPWHSAVEFKRYLHRFMLGVLADRDPRGRQADDLQPVRFPRLAAEGLARRARGARTLELQCHGLEHVTGRRQGLDHRD